MKIRFRKPSALFSMVLMIALLAGGFAGCGLLPITKPLAWSEMTPRQKTIQILHTYNTLYDDYKIQAAVPDLTEAQRQVLRVKKDVFEQVYPLITVYDDVIVAGGIPSPESELEILNLLNLIGAKIGG